ncbi:MAG: sulfite exporter TauE/SafE family protein, partial [Planctomycetota bacterium]|nr:sulfite exporter TauE/SafE family protein [Planctomycetota bacterium]
PFVVALWLPVLIACDMATIRQYPKEWSPRAFTRLAPGMLMGIIATTCLLSTIDLKAPPSHLKMQEAWLKLFIALIATVFVVMQLLPKKAAGDVAWDPPWIASIPIGFIAGVTTMVAHAAGTIITMFFLPMKLDKRVFVGTTGRFFFVFNTLKLPFYLFIGWITWETTRYGIWLMILGPLGVLFGSWMNKRVSAVLFVRLIYIFLIFAVGKLVWDWYGTVFAASA